MRIQDLYLTANELAVILTKRLYGFFNLIYGSPEEASLRLHHIPVGSRSVGMSTNDVDGIDMLKIFIEHYAEIAQRAEWKTSAPLGNAQTIDSWYEQGSGNELEETIMLLSLKSLLGYTDTSHVDEDLDVLLLQSNMEEIVSDFLGSRKKSSYQILKTF